MTAEAALALLRAGDAEGALGCSTPRAPTTRTRHDTPLAA